MGEKGFPRPFKTVSLKGLHVGGRRCVCVCVSLSLSLFFHSLLLGKEKDIRLPGGTKYRRNDLLRKVTQT